MENYVTELTASMIKALSIGGSAPETVWFWVKGALIFRMAVMVVDAFL
jgi:hypothetical protein